MHALFLKHAEAAGVSVLNGKYLEDITQPAEAEKNRQLGVTAHFSDGSILNGNILIGCDGINSATRRYIHGPQKSHFTGAIAVLCVVNKPARSVRLSSISGKGAESWHVRLRQRRDTLVCSETERRRAETNQVDAFLGALITAKQNSNNILIFSYTNTQKKQ